jgi:nucleolar GTP-binding protein
MLHLPSAVVFVIDPTDLAGPLSTLDRQLNVRDYLKQRFPRRPWLDVVSKCDLLYSPEGNILEEHSSAVYKALGVPHVSSFEHLLPAGHLKVSMKNGMNKQLIQSKIKEIVKELAKKKLEDR